MLLKKVKGKKTVCKKQFKFAQQEKKLKRK